MTTPAFLPYVIKAVAQIKEMEETEVADQILQNFTNLFGIRFTEDVSDNGR